ncbi:hypothetical protein N9N28_16330 [Rubripirellula amarantea]|nr:hypothetical protein [Rubripirellula amarantea]
MRSYLKHLGISGLVLGVLLLAGNLPMRLKSVYTEGKLQQWEGEAYVLSDSPPLPVAAGWPEDFYLRYDDIANNEPFVWWSTAALLRNVGVGSLIITSVASLVFFVRRKRSGSTVEPKSNVEQDEGQVVTPPPTHWQRLNRVNIRFGIADMLLATGTVAMPLAFYQWQNRTSGNDLKTAQAMGPDSSFTREAIIPAIIADWMPDFLLNQSLKEALLRTTMVSLKAPKDQHVSTAISLPHLRVLAIGGGDYDLEQLAPLPNCPRITSLNLSGRELDDSTLTRIRMLDNLRDLVLSRTNVSHITIERLFEQRIEAVSRLKYLGLIDTGVELSPLSNSPVFNTMTSLTCLELPRPMPGTDAEFVLPPMPKLQRLKFISQDRGKNSSILKITVNDCPQLSLLSIGIMQKCSLDLSNLPKLKSIQSYSFKTILRLARRQSVPGTLWIESLTGHQLPAFEEATIYAPDLRQIRLTETPRFRNLYPAVFSTNSSYYTGGKQFDEISREATEALVEGIVQSDGPEKIDYSTVPLQGAKLGRLLKNDRVQELYLHDCGLRLEDIEHLSGDSTLRTISLQGNPLGSAEIGKLISGMPKLERWHGDLYQLQRLRIENHEHVRGVVDRLPNENSPDRTHLPHCDALRLINLPQWVTPIRLDAASYRHLTIQDLPKLQQLVIDAPVCKDTVLSGLHGLTTIAVGGKYLDDSVIDDWPEYSALRSLRLYGTLVSPDGFTKLLNNKKLTLVDFQDSKINDDAFLSMDPSFLASVTLIQTQATEASVRHALKSPSITRLNVHDISIDESLGDQILNRQQLRSLGLNGSTLTPNQFKKVAAMPALETLSLSSVHLDMSLATTIANGGQSALRTLTLVDSKADGPAVRALMRQLRGLKLELIRTEIPAVLEGDLFGSGRLVTEESPENPLYCRGPDGMMFPIFKGASTGAFITNFGRFTPNMMNPDGSFVPISEESFLMLTPHVFREIRAKDTEPTVLSLESEE